MMMKLNIKKIMVLAVSMNMTFASVAMSQGVDADPEIMGAMLDANNTNKSLQQPMTSTIDPLEAAVNTGASVSAPKVASPEVKKEVKKEVAKPKKKEAIVLTAEETALINKMDDAEVKKEITSVETKGLKKDEAPVVNKKQIYLPAPVEAKNSDEPYMDRDSTLVQTKYMGINDVLTVKMCFNSGLSIALDPSIDDELSNIRKDDNEFIGAEPSDNRRGVYIHLNKEIEEDKHWESAIRLYRKSDDKLYLINILAVTCPKFGMTPFAKVIYLKDKPGIIGKNTNVLTPEDTIIAQSRGWPRIQKNRIRVYDMVASSGSEWVVFGVEVQLPNNSSTDMRLPKMTMLDNHQVSVLPSGLEYLPVQSQKATELRGVSTLRYKLTVNIGKRYIMNSRYIHLMYLDEEGKYYQYIRVDTLPYFISLKNRGFEI